MNDDRPIRILFVEDVASDAQLAEQLIRQEGLAFEAKLVETEDDFTAALEDFRPDVIVSDYALPTFDGMRALQITRHQDSALPFIILTGSMNEETAVACMKAGASDYVIKEHMARLPFAIREVLAQYRSLKEREAVEQELRSTEAQYRLLAENMSDTVWLFDLAEGRFTFVSPSVERLLGYTVPDMLGMTMLDILTPSWRPNAADMLHTRLEAFAAGDESMRTQTHDLPSVRKDGTIMPTEIVSTLIVDADRQTRQVLGVSRDVRERKSAEEALRESEERFRTLVDNAPDGIFVEGEGRFQYLNPAMAQMLGANGPEDLVGAECAALVDAPEREGPGPSTEQEYLRLDGSRIPVESNTVHTQYQGDPARLVFVRDRTHRKQTESERAELQQQLQQSQKMESIGRLAGGVAHDFNNILMVQKGYCELMREGLRSQDPIAQGLSLIEQCVDRAAKLTRQLLAFSRRQTLSPMVIDVNVLVEHLLEMLRRLLGEDVDLFFDPTPEPALVLADSGQLEQVVVNLSVNARDAMPSGGRLTIEVSEMDSDTRDGRGHPRIPPGSYVVLTVSDTGCGMTEDVKTRAFEPFFTTKGEGGGTGLGLSTVYGIVQQSNGHILVESEFGRGTTFRIYLPRVEAELPQPAGPTVGVSQGHGELVLIVEDEHALRQLAALMVQRLGYRTIEASNAGAALLMVEEEGLRPDIVLTDAVMPGMNGAILVERLLRTIPDLSVVCMSGYAADAMAPGVRFLPKPFSMANLAAMLGETLASQ